MIALRNRISAAIAGLGDSFTVGAGTFKGIFGILPAERAADFFSDAEWGATARPCYRAYVGYDDATAVAATVTWNGLSLTVLKKLSLRLKDTTLAKVLLLA